MAELRRGTPDGHWQVYGWRQSEMELAWRLGARLAKEGARFGEFTDFGEERAYWKGGPLATRPAIRHAIRARLLRVPPPRLAEYFQLSWMTERHFRCALPLAGAVLWRGGLPRYQFLATRAVPGARSMDSFLREPSDDRAAVLEELARETARLHALRFVHRDLYPRNLLVAPEEAGRRVVFLDAWRGGERVQTRGAAHDLGCFFLSAADTLSRDEQRRFWADYVDERAAQGRPVRAGLARRVERARSRERAKLARDPARLRGRAMPSAGWTAPVAPR